LKIMNWRLVMTAVAAGLVGLAPGFAVVEEASVIELAVPRSVAAGETVQLIVRAGRLPKGARLQVTSEEGETLGALAPFGPQLGGGSSAAIPVQRSHIMNDRVRLRLVILEPNAPPRAPRAGEIESLRLIVLPRP
jgi:hypothetical protein